MAAASYIQGNWRIRDEREDFRVQAAAASWRPEPVSAPRPSTGTTTETQSARWTCRPARPTSGNWARATPATSSPSRLPVAAASAELVVASGTTLKVIDAGGTPMAGRPAHGLHLRRTGVTTPDTATLNANMTIDHLGDHLHGEPELRERRRRHHLHHRAGLRRVPPTIFRRPGSRRLPGLTGGDEDLRAPTARRPTPRRPASFRTPTSSTFGTSTSRMLEADNVHDSAVTDGSFTFTHPEHATPADDVSERLRVVSGRREFLRRWSRGQWHDFDLRAGARITSSAWE